MHFMSSMQFTLKNSFYARMVNKTEFLNVVIFAKHADITCQEFISFLLHKLRYFSKLIISVTCHSNSWQVISAGFVHNGLAELNPCSMLGVIF